MSTHGAPKADRDKMNDAMLDKVKAARARASEKVGEQLLSASQKGELETVKRLVKEGASVKERDKNGRTGLLLAAQSGALDVVQWLLLEGGASVAEQDSTGMTALLLAGTSAVARWLLSPQGGARVTERSHRGGSALLWASYHGHLEVVQWLLTEGGSDISDRNDIGFTALLAATYNNQVEVVKWLLTGGWCTLQETDSSGRTALILACFAEVPSLDVMRWLVTEGGARVEQERFQNSSVLHIAALRGKLELVQWLLTEKRANPAECEQGTDATALLLAARGGHLETVKWLLTSGGSKIEEHDGKGMTALLWASHKGHLNVLQWLLAEGGAKVADRNPQNGNTSLLLACRNDKMEVVQWLLRKGGASFVEHNDKGHTPLCIALKMSKLVLAEWLLVTGGVYLSHEQKSAALHDACMCVPYPSRLVVELVLWGAELSTGLAEGIQAHMPELSSVVTASVRFRMTEQPLWRSRRQGLLADILFGTCDAGPILPDWPAGVVYEYASWSAREVAELGPDQTTIDAIDELISGLPPPPPKAQQKEQHKQLHIPRGSTVKQHLALLLEEQSQRNKKLVFCRS